MIHIGRSHLTLEQFLNNHRTSSPYVENAGPCLKVKMFIISKHSQVANVKVWKQIKKFLLELSTFFTNYHIVKVLSIYNILILLLKTSFGSAL